MCDTMVNETKLTDLHESSTKLCRAIEEHPCLYDRNNSQYLKREAADAAWEVIAEHCDDSVESCKVRWRNIRSAYMRSLQGSISRNRVSNRTRDYYLHNELKFYWPYVPIGNSEKVDCADDSDDDELNTSVHSKGGSGNNEAPKRIKDRRKSTYKAINKISEQSKTDLNLDDEDDDSDNVSRGEKEQKQAEVIDKSTERPTPQQTKLQTFYIKKIPKKDGTIILKKHGQPETLNFQSEININNLNDDQMATLENRVRFKRACKRGIDKTIIRELSVRKHKANEKRMRLSYHEAPDETATTWDAVEINAESTPMEQKEEEHDNTRQLNHDQHISRKCEPPLTQHDENQSKSTVPVVYIERAIQCEIEKPIKNIGSDRSDEDFLNMLRPRLEEMNRREKLKFQMKVFECLISALDDSTDSSTFDHETQTPKNMPIESTIAGELRLIRELVTKQQASVVQRPIMADAATTTTNDTVPGTIVAACAINTDNANLAEKKLKQPTSTYYPRSTPDKTANNIDKKKCADRIDSQNSINTSLITTMASAVGTFIIPCTPDTGTNTLVSATSRFERTNSGPTVTMATGNGVAENPTTTNSKSASLLNARTHIVRRYSICCANPLTNMTREPHQQQIITTSANVPSTTWDSCTTAKPRRVMRNLTIHKFDEPGRQSPNKDSLLVPRTVAATTILTTSTTTEPTSSVSRNASSTRSSYIKYMSPKLLPHIQIPQQQSTVVPGVLASVRTTTPSVVSGGSGSTTVTASASRQPKTLTLLDTKMTPKVSRQSLLKKLDKDVNVKESGNSGKDETGTAAIFTSDEFSVFPIKTEPLDEHLL